MQGRSIAFAICVVAVACSGESSGGDGPGDAPADAGDEKTSPDASTPADDASSAPGPTLPREQFNDAMATASCDTIETCCVANHVNFDMETCRNRAMKDPGEEVSYDGEMAAKCIALVKDAASKCGVTAPGAVLGYCGKVFTPTREIGELCTKVDACKGGVAAGIDCVDKQCTVVRSMVARGAPCDGVHTVCDATVDFCDLGKGICVAYPKQGEACVGVICRPDLVCNKDLKCEPGVAVGQPCDLASPNCVSDASCRGPLDGATCVAKADLGQSCEEADCKEFLLCDGKSKTCVVSAFGADQSRCIYP